MTELPSVLHLGTAQSWRGGEQQIAYLFEELSKQGVGQTLLAAKNSPLAQYGRKKQWNVHTASKKSSLPLNMARKLAQLCAENTFDLVHLHDSHAHTTAILAASFFGLSQDLVVSRRVDFPVGKTWFSRFKYNHPQVKRIVCVSEEIKKVMARSIRQPERLRVIHSGVDLQKFPAKVPGKLRQEFDISPDRLLVGNVAALADHKDYPTFIDTVALLKENGTEAIFIIMGDGPERDSIVEYARRKKVSDKIIFTGFRTDIVDLLPELDLLLFTSKMEGLGTSLLDAQAAGVPIVATKAGGIPEIIKDGINGKLAPVGDAKALATAVHEVLTNKGLRRQLSQAGHQSVKSFSKDQMAQRMLEQYQNILQNEQSTP